MLSVTADTNIFISAFNYQGKPRQVVDLANAGAIRLDLSEHIIWETTHVLMDRFGWSPEAAAIAEELMRRVCNLVTPTEVIDVVKEDPADNRILECARAAGSDFIVTGDKDLLRIRQYAGIQIVSVSDFLDLAPWPTA